jgi:hypothetical protein
MTVVLEHAKLCLLSMYELHLKTKVMIMTYRHYEDYDI